MATKDDCLRDPVLSPMFALSGQAQALCLFCPMFSVCFPRRVLVRISVIDDIEWLCSPHLLMAAPLYSIMRLVFPLKNCFTSVREPRQRRGRTEVKKFGPFRLIYSQCMATQQYGADKLSRAELPPMKSWMRTN